MNCGFQSLSKISGTSILPLHMLSSWKKQIFKKEKLVLKLFILWNDFWKIFTYEKISTFSPRLQVKIVLNYNGNGLGFFLFQNIFSSWIEWRYSFLISKMFYQFSLYVVFHSKNGKNTIFTLKNSIKGNLIESLRNEKWISSLNLSWKNILE